MCRQGYQQLLLQHYFLCKNALMVSFTTFTCSSQYYFCPEGCFHQTRHLRSDTLTSAVGIANNIHKTGVTHISVSSLLSATVTAEHKAFLPLCPLIPPWICFWLLSCRSLSLPLSLWLCTLFPWKILPVIIVGIGWCHCACSVFETGQYARPPHLQQLCGGGAAAAAKWSREGEMKARHPSTVLTIGSLPILGKPFQVWPQRERAIKTPVNAYFYVCVL